MRHFLKLPIDKDPCQCYAIDDKDSCQLDRESCQRGGALCRFTTGSRSTGPGWGSTSRRWDDLAGVSRQTISQIERGDYSPSVTLALKLAKICGVAVEDIFSYEEDEA